MTTPALHSPRTYPTLKILLGFALLGGVLGGLLVTLFIAIYSEQWRIFVHRGDMLFFLLFGVKLGTAPALLTASWLAWRRAYRNGQGLLHAALAGAFFSAIAAPVSAPLIDPGYDLTKMLLVFMPPTGALSALLLGIGLLPKAYKEQSYG